MNIDNRNEDLNWQSKLSGLDGLPGEVFNKDDAWRKLHARENKKKKFIKPVWYYVAAACLIIIFLLISFWSNKIEKVLVKNNGDRTPVNKSATISVKNNDKDSVVTVSTNRVSNDVYPPLETQKRVVVLKKSKPNIKNNIIVINETPKPLAGDITDSVATNKPSSDITAVPTFFPRKKLTVVHINELGEIPEQPIVVRKTETHSFRLSFGKQEVFTNPSIPSVKDGFTIFSTKNSPN